MLKRYEGYYKRGDLFYWKEDRSDIYILTIVPCDESKLEGNYTDWHIFLISLENGNRLHMAHKITYRKNDAHPLNSFYAPKDLYIFRDVIWIGEYRSVNKIKRKKRGIIMPAEAEIVLYTETGMFYVVEKGTNNFLKSPHNNINGFEKIEEAKAVLLLNQI